ncbi:MAG TPA: hypothetical protein VFZ11_12010 [Gemmatimonadaceae bacterium]
MRRLPLVSTMLALALLAARGASAQDVPARDSASRDTLPLDSAARDAAVREAIARDSAERAEARRDSLASAARSRSDLRHAAVFFADRTPLELTLTANLRALRAQTQEHDPWLSARLSYRPAGAEPVELAAQVRSRGNFRLKLCDFPPIRLRMRRADREGTVLEGLRRPKLVTYCKDREEYEQYVLQEYLAYRIYEQLTPISLRARLARITYVDSATGRPAATRFGMVLEEEESLAARLDGVVLEAHGARPHHLDPFQATLLAVFQYMIGNTDWSIPALHNIFLVQTVPAVHPVAYDFDFAGIVNARYAAPDPKLGITRVTQRLYRGSCATVDEIPGVLDHVRAQREAIVAILDEPSELHPRHARRIRDFIEDFYELIESPRRVQVSITERCIPVN